MRYFIGNWKMFGVPKSINIINKINAFVKKDKKRKKYSAIIAPPYTLVESFSKIFRNKSVSIGAQNCFHKDPFSSKTNLYIAFHHDHAAAAAAPAWTTSRPPAPAAVRPQRGLGMRNHTEMVTHNAQPSEHVARDTELVVATTCAL